MQSVHAVFGEHALRLCLEITHPRSGPVGVAALRGGAGVYFEVVDEKTPPCVLVILDAGGGCTRQQQVITSKRSLPVY